MNLLICVKLREEASINFVNEVEIYLRQIFADTIIYAFPHKHKSNF